MLVVDASVAVAASHSPIGLSRLKAHLVAPYLLQAEAGSVLHESGAGRSRPSAGRRCCRASRQARWSWSRQMACWKKPGRSPTSWAGQKTYDAHYVALARLLRCRLVTIDERLLRGIAGLEIAVRPREI